MRKTFLVGLGTALLAGWLGLTLVVLRANSLLRRQLAAQQVQVSTYQHLTSEKDGLISDLQSKIEQLTEVVSNQSARLAEALAELNNYEAKLQNILSVQSREAAVQQVLASAPALVVTNFRDGSRVLVFRKLIGTSGTVLGTGAEYSATYGRRVAFRFEDGSRASYDVDELHPTVLEALGIDSDAAKRAQARLDRAWQIRKQNDALLLARIQAEHARALQRAAEQERKQEELRQRQFQERLAMLQLHNQRLQTEALVRAANAAILNAYKPPPTIINQNVNRNVIWW